jgi:hypothetical protein
MNIYGISDFLFYFWAICFGLSTILAIYAPGSFFISRLKIKSSILQILLAHVLGITLWAAQGVLLGYLQIRWATYIYLAFFIGAFLLRFKTEIQTHLRAWSELQTSNSLTRFLAGLGISTQMLSIFGSGLRFSDGIGLFGANALDGVMHLGFIQEMTQRFPPQEPGAIGFAVINYHLWSDVVMAELARIFYLPVTHLFFQYMPIYISLLTVLALYILIKIWGGTRSVANWALFLFFFAGDTAYVFMLALHRIFGFYTPAIDNGMTQFLNVPHTFAKLIFLCSLMTLTIWLHRRTKAWGLLTVILMGTLVGFKVYFGIFAALGFSLVVGAQLIHDFAMHVKKKGFYNSVKNALLNNSFSLFLVLLFAALSALIYFPINKGAGGLFYSPLEWPRLFLGQDYLNFNIWWLRKQVYEAHHNIPALLALDLFAIGVCLICVYGTRLLGFIPSMGITKKIPWQIHIFFYPTMIIFTLLGLYTLQTSGLFNVFNFFIVAVIGLSIFAAFWLAEIQKRKTIIGYLFLIIFVLLSIPRPLYEIFHMIEKYAKHDFALVIRPDEEQALQYLRTQTPVDSVVQSHIGNVKDSQAPYISYFSNRSSYLAGISMIESHGQPIESRRKELKSIFSGGAEEELATQLGKYQIRYLYLRKNEESDQLPFVPNSGFFTVAFENPSILILQTNK